MVAAFRAARSLNLGQAREPCAKWPGRMRQRLGAAGTTKTIRRPQPVACSSTCMARQEPRRLQLRRIAMVFDLVTRQRHQLGFGLRRDRWLLARSRTIIEGRHRPVRARHSAAPSHDEPLIFGPPRRTKDFPIRQRICARDTRFASSVRDRESVVKVAISSSLIANSTARRHPAMMQFLVSPPQNEESANKPSVPPTSLIH